MKPRWQDIEKRERQSLCVVRFSVIAPVAFGAVLLSLFTSFSIMLGVLGYYRMQPHYLSKHNKAPAYMRFRAEIHASPDEETGLLRRVAEKAELYAYGKSRGGATPGQILRLANHVTGKPGAVLERRGAIIERESARKLRTFRFGVDAGENLLKLAAAAFPDPRKETPECPRLCDAILEVTARHGIPESALSMELIRPSIMQRKTITRITAFLPEHHTPELLYQDIKNDLQGAGIATRKTVLSEQRTLIQAVYCDDICVELLCIKPEPFSDGPAPPWVAETPLISSKPIQNFNPDSEDTEAVQDRYPEAAAADHQTDALIASAAADVRENKKEGKEGEVPITGYVAIILDDGGYGGTELERVLKLDNRLTLAILPDTPFARETAERGTQNGFEIMLHMPMQAGNGTRNRFPGEIKVCMTKEQIQTRSRECIAQFPEALGANNHTGGLYTANAEKMGWFLEVVKEEGMYFVDSRTVGSSCAFDKAIEMGIPCACRDIFLDHSNRLSDVRKSFQTLVAFAQKHGWAVGIGHFRPNTITVLAEELPKLEENGIALIPMSEMVW